MIMPDKKTRSKDNNIDYSIAIPGVLMILLLCLLFLFINATGEKALLTVFNLITFDLGGIYLIYVFIIICILIYIAATKTGSIKLGEGAPQYSNISWISMLFCACIGSSILYWGVIEWIYYFQSPPFGIEPFSAEAAELSIGYSMFHWGISGWATYCLAAIIIAYCFFVRKNTQFRISASCGMLGESKSRKKDILAKVIDVFVIVGLCSGVAVSIAIGTPMVAYGLNIMFNVPMSTLTNVFIAVFWAAIFSASALSGIDKGIKVLSNANSLIAIIFIAFIFIYGNTSFMFNNAVNSVGYMLQNYLRMSFYTDPVSQTGFPQTWTVFYWAWWISYVPVMGLFIAKISRGRTIRQVIIGTTVFGSLGCWMFQAVLSGYALNLQLTGILDSVAALKAGGDYATIMAILNTLPFPKAAIFVFVVLAFIFLATTCDSSAYILATIASKRISVYDEPGRLNRLIWCVTIILWPIVLIILGGMESVKLCSIIGSLPLLVIFGVMIYNFFKDVVINTNKNVKLP